MTTKIRDELLDAVSREKAGLMGPTASRMPTVRDYPLSLLSVVNTFPISNSYHEIATSGDLEAIGLHGYLPPGTIALIGPRSRAADFENYINKSGAYGRKSNFDPTPVIPPAPAATDIFHLAPGQVIRVTDTIAADGILVAVYSPWLYNDGAVSPIIGPSVVALLRLYNRGSLVPAALTWMRGFGVHRYDGIPPTQDPNIAPLNLFEYSAIIPPEASRVMVYFRDDGPSSPEADPIASGESGSYEIWWLLPAGFWVHHESDDMDAGARGLVSRAHSYEVYSPPPGAVACLARKVSGNDFWARYIVA